MRHKRWYAGIGLGLVLVLSLAWGLGGKDAGVASAAGDTEPRLINVSGQGEVMATPDEAQVNVAVETTADTAKAAQEINSRDTAQVIASLKKLGIADKDIKTVQLQLYPVYEESPKPPAPQQQPAPKVVGFRAVNSLNVTVRQLDTVGKVLDTVVSAGANRIQGISFGFANPKPLQDQALELAVQDARRQAELVARTAGVQIKGIRTVNVSGGFYPIQRTPMLFDEMRAAAAPPVMPGEMTIRAQVSVSFEF